jgi:hypothetical protein
MTNNMHWLATLLYSMHWLLSKKDLYKDIVYLITCEVVQSAYPPSDLLDDTSALPIGWNCGYHIYFHVCGITRSSLLIWWNLSADQLGYKNGSETALKQLVTTLVFFNSKLRTCQHPDIFSALWGWREGLQELLLLLMVSLKL